MQRFITALAILAFLASSSLAAWNRATGPDRLPEAPYIAGQLMIATDEDNAFMVGGFDNAVPIGGGATFNFPSIPICLASTQKLIFNGYAALAPWTCETDGTGAGCAAGGTCAAQIAAPFSPAFQLLSGSTTVNAVNQIVGISTKFTTEVKVGDRVRVSTDLTKNGVVQSIFDDTHLVTSSPLGNGSSQSMAVNKSPLAASALAYTYCGGQGGEMYTNANASTTLEVCELSSPNCTASVLCTPSYSLVIGDVVRLSSNNFSTRHRVLSISDAGHSVNITPAAGNNTGNQQILVERVGMTALSNGDWMAGTTFTNRDPQNPNSSGFNEMAPDLYYSAGHKQFLARTMHLTERGDTPELFFVRIGDGPFPYSPQAAADQLASGKVPGIIRWYGSSQDTVVQLATLYVRALETVANAAHGGAIYLATVPIGGTVEQVMLQVTSTGIKVGCEDGSSTCGATPIGIQFLGASDSNNYVTLRGPAAPAGTSAVATVEELTGTVCTTNASSACLSGSYGDITAVGTCTGGACFTTGVAGHQLSSDDELLMMVDVNNDDTTRGVRLRHDGSTTDLIVLREDGQVIIQVNSGVFRSNDDDGSHTGSWRAGALTADRIWDGPNASGTVQLGPLSADVVTTAAGVATIQTGAVTTGKILDGTILAADLKSVDVAADEECLTRETGGGGDFEWQTCGGGGGLSTVGDCVTDPCFDGTNGRTLTAAAGLVFNLNTDSNLIGNIDTNNNSTTACFFLYKNAADAGGTLMWKACESSGFTLSQPLVLWDNYTAGGAPVVDWTPTFTISAAVPVIGLQMAPTITDSNATIKELSIISSSPTLEKNAAGANTYNLLRDGGFFSATSTNPIGTLNTINSFSTVTNATASNQAAAAVYGLSYHPQFVTSSTGNLTVATVAGSLFQPIINATAGSTITITNGYGLALAPLLVGGGTQQFTNIYGVDVPAVVGTTSAVALRSQIAAASGAYGFKFLGTAQSATAGKFLAGSSGTPATDVDMVGGLSTRKSDNTTTCTSCTSADIDATNKSFIKITGAAAGARTLHGVGGGVNGQRLTIYNSDTKDLTVSSDSATEGTAGNRILTLGDPCTMLGTGYVDLVYDSTASRWVGVGCSPPIASGYSVGVAAATLLSGTTFLGQSFSNNTEDSVFAPMLPGNYSRIDCHVSVAMNATCAAIFTVKKGACTGTTGSNTALICGILNNSFCSGAGFAFSGATAAACCTGAGTGTCNNLACSFSTTPVLVSAGDCGDVSVVSTGGGCPGAGPRTAYCTTR